MERNPSNKREPGFWMAIGITVTLLVAVACSSVALAQYEKQEANAHPEVDYTINCVDCHREKTPERVAAWQSSKHGLMNFGCYLCHGDGEVEFTPKPQTANCSSCHSAAHDGEIETPDFIDCYSCHDPHTLELID
jgi:hypothetical protein